MKESIKKVVDAGLDVTDGLITIRLLGDGRYEVHDGYIIELEKFNTFDEAYAYIQTKINVE